MVLTGSELVTGVIADANGPWLAHELTARGFEVLPKRWVVERTFAWLYKHRRLSKDYEFLAETSANSA